MIPRAKDLIPDPALRVRIAGEKRGSEMCCEVEMLARIIHPVSTIATRKRVIALSFSAYCAQIDCSMDLPKFRSAAPARSWLPPSSGRIRRRLTHCRRAMALSTSRSSSQRLLTSAIHLTKCHCELLSPLSSLCIAFRLLRGPPPKLCGRQPQLRPQRPLRRRQSC